jgi:hypothetical protein
MSAFCSPASAEPNGLIPPRQMICSANSSRLRHHRALHERRHSSHSPVNARRAFVRSGDSSLNFVISVILVHSPKGGAFFTPEDRIQVLPFPTADVEHLDNDEDKKFRKDLSDTLRPLLCRNTLQSVLPNVLSVLKRAFPTSSSRLRTPSTLSAATSRAQSLRPRQVRALLAGGRRTSLTLRFRSSGRAAPTSSPSSAST